MCESTLWVLWGDWFLGRDVGPGSRLIGLPTTDEFLEAGFNSRDAEVMGMGKAATEEVFTVGW